MHYIYLHVCMIIIPVTCNHAVSVALCPCIFVVMHKLLQWTINYIGISASTIKVPQPLCVKQYVESLKAEYIRMPILKKDPWPPPPCEKYCDLIWAFTNEKMKFGDSLAEIFEVDIGKLQLLVNGMPGVGKTTFCKQIAKEWANGEILQNYDIVLLIQLRDPQNSGAKAYGDFFYHDEEHIKKEVIKHIGRCSGEGVLFIFDGFDELSKRDRNKGSLFLDIFNGKKLKESSVVIASRPYASHNLEYSQCIELIGFDDDLIKSCIQESIKDKAEAEQLQIRIIEDNDLKQLCTVPNNLAIVIYIYKQENRVLPNTLTKLYSNFIRNTVDRNAQDLKHKKRAKYERYLEELAFKGLSEDKLTFTVDEMSVEEASTLGLMTASESYGSSGRKIAYNFLHLTIQEYLAACWIASNFTAKEQIQFVRSNYDDSRFFVSLKFLAGLSKLPNSDFNDALQLILEMALNDAYFHVTSGNRLNDANSYRPFYSGKQLQSLQFLVSLLRERDEISAIDGENMQSCSSNDDQVLLLDLKHIPSNYNQILLRSFILKSRITWERLEVMFDRTKGYEQLTELLKESCCNVRQLGLHNFSLLNCSDLLECPMFDKLEYLRVDSILHFREVCFNDQTVRWGADNNPKDCDKLKNLLKNGQLKHLLLHHITPLEADYIVRQSVTPYLAKCINLETLCLHFERKVPSELLLDLFQAVQSNRSIVTLNLSIGFDTLAIQPPFNPNIPACISYIKVNERHKIVKALHKMIEKNISIQNLSITRTESIRDNVFHWVDDTSNFMSVFSFKPTITTLTISCNLLYVPLLGELLKHNKTLTSLTLTEVDSMYKGVLKSSRGIFIFLVQGLKQNTTLKRLCLNSSKFHFSGQYYPKCENCALDSAVFMNGIVKAEIDSNNHLFHLLKAIQSHLSLEVLVFDYYSELQEQKILFTCTEEFKRTTQFCLFSDKNQKALFDLLLHNKCLQSLTISGFNFTGIQLRQAAQALVLNGHRASFNIMLTENLSKDDDFNKSFMDLFNFKDDKRNQPHSDVIRSSVMSIRSVQKLQESHKDEATNASDSKQSSDDSESYDHDFQKVDKNGDSIQDDVIEFKEVMFRAMVTVFSKILCNRHVHQHCFLKHANRPSLT